MRYLVVLDANSSIGQIYLNGSNDGYVAEGEERHPVLDCAEVDIHQPYYLFAKRDMSKQGSSHQSLHISHSSVLFVQIYADEGPRPIGFHPPDAADPKHKGAAADP